MAKRFCFTIDGKVFHALLQENNLTEQLERLCPFEIDLQKRGGYEYYTRLPEPYDSKDCQIISKIRKNQITYFSDWNALSFLYNDADISPFTVAYLGKFEEDAAVSLSAAGQVIHVCCELDQEGREERDG